MRYRNKTHRSAARLKVVIALTLLAGVLTPAGAMVYKPADGARVYDTTGACAPVQSVPAPGRVRTGVRPEVQPETGPD